MSSDQDKPYKPRNMTLQGQPLGLRVPALMKTLSKSGNFGAGFGQIQQAWGQEFGELAAFSAPKSYSRGVVTIVCTSSSGMQQLQYWQPTIIAKINAVLGRSAVRGVKFCVGQLPAVVARDVEVLKRRDIPTDGLKQAEEPCAIVRDGELRNILQRLGGWVYSDPQTKNK